MHRDAEVRLGTDESTLNTGGRMNSPNELEILSLPSHLPTDYKDWVNPHSPHLMGCETRKEVARNGGLCVCSSWGDCRVHTQNLAAFEVINI